MPYTNRNGDAYTASDLFVGSRCTPSSSSSVVPEDPCRNGNSELRYRDPREVFTEGEKREPRDGDKREPREAPSRSGSPQSQRNAGHDAREGQHTAVEDAVSKVQFSPELAESGLPDSPSKNRLAHPGPHHPGLTPQGRLISNASVFRDGNSPRDDHSDCGHLMGSKNLIYASHRNRGRLGVTKMKRQGHNLDSSLLDSSQLEPMDRMRRKQPAKYLLVSFGYGVIMAFITVMQMSGMAFVWFKDEQYRRVKNFEPFRILAVSNVVHQAMMTSGSALSYLIVSADETSLVLLSKFSTYMIKDWEGAKTEELIATMLWVSANWTIFAGVVLRIVCYYKLSDYVNGVPLPVVGGFIGYSAWFLISSGISLSGNVDFQYPWDLWKQEVIDKLFDVTKDSYYAFYKVVFCLVSALAMLLVDVYSEDQNALLMLMIAIPIGFYVVAHFEIGGVTFENAADLQWFADSSGSPASSTRASPVITSRGVSSGTGSVSTAQGLNPTNSTNSVGNTTSLLRVLSGDDGSAVSYDGSVGSDGTMIGVSSATTTNIVLLSSALPDTGRLLSSTRTTEEPSEEPSSYDPNWWKCTLSDVNMDTWDFYNVDYVSWKYLFFSYADMLTKFWMAHSFGSALDYVGIANGVQPPGTDNKKKLDYNHELGCLGVSHLFSGVLGGLPANMDYDATKFGGARGMTGKAVGFSMAFVLLLFALIPINIVGHLPKPYIGSILVFMGCQAFKEWFIDTRNPVSRSEYSALWISLLCCLLGDYYAGLTVGVVLAFFVHCATFSVVHAREAAFKVRPYKCGSYVRTLEQTEILKQHIYNDLLIISFSTRYLFFGYAMQLLNIHRKLYRLTHFQREVGSGQQMRLVNFRFLVFDFTRITHVGWTCATVLSDIIHDMKDDGIIEEIVFVGIKHQSVRLMLSQRNLIMDAEAQKKESAVATLGAVMRKSEGTSEVTRFKQDIHAGRTARGRKRRTTMRQRITGFFNARSASGTAGSTVPATSTPKGVPAKQKQSPSKGYFGFFSGRSRRPSCSTTDNSTIRPEESTVRRDESHVKPSVIDSAVDGGVSPRINATIMTIAEEEHNASTVSSESGHNAATSLDAAESPNNFAVQSRKERTEGDHRVSFQIADEDSVQSRDQSKDSGPKHLTPNYQSKVGFAGGRPEKKVFSIDAENENRTSIMSDRPRVYRLSSNSQRPSITSQDGLEIDAPAAIELPTLQDAMNYLEERILERESEKTESVYQGQALTLAACWKTYFQEELSEFIIEGQDQDQNSKVSFAPGMASPRAGNREIAFPMTPAMGGGKNAIVFDFDSKPLGRQESSDLIGDLMTGSNTARNSKANFHRSASGTLDTGEHQHQGVKIEHKYGTNLVVVTTQKTGVAADGHGHHANMPMVTPKVKHGFKFGLNAFEDEIDRMIEEMDEESKKVPDEEDLLWNTGKWDGGLFPPGGFPDLPPSGFPSVGDAPTLAVIQPETPGPKEKKAVVIDESKIESQEIEGITPGTGSASSGGAASSGDCSNGPKPVNEEKKMKGKRRSFATLQLDICASGTIGGTSAPTPAGPGSVPKPDMTEEASVATRINPGLKPQPALDSDYSHVPTTTHTQKPSKRNRECRKAIKHLCSDVLMTKVVLPPGEVIFEAGEPADFFFFVRAGSVELHSQENGTNFALEEERRFTDFLIDFVEYQHPGIMEVFKEHQKRSRRNRISIFDADTLLKKEEMMERTEEAYNPNQSRFGNFHSHGTKQTLSGASASGGAGGADPPRSGSFDPNQSPHTMSGGKRGSVAMNFNRPMAILGLGGDDEKEKPAIRVPTTISKVTPSEEEMPKMHGVCPLGIPEYARRACFTVNARAGPRGCVICRYDREIIETKMNVRTSSFFKDFLIREMVRTLWNQQ